MNRISPRVSIIRYTVKSVFMRHESLVHISNYSSLRHELHVHISHLSFVRYEPTAHNSHTPVVWHESRVHTFHLSFMRMNQTDIFFTHLSCHMDQMHIIPATISCASTFSCGAYSATVADEARFFGSFPVPSARAVRLWSILTYLIRD